MPNGASIVLMKGEDVSYIGGQVTNIIDTLGEASSIAQGLGNTITTHSKLVNSQGNQNLFMIV